MDGVLVVIGGERFEARFLVNQAPATCAKFRSLMPYRQNIIHVRWSGEACWIPLGDLDLGVPLESPTSYPRPGEFILYPGGASETEILLAYGAVQFASKAGQLAGTPFLAISEKLDRLAEIGREVLWGGSREISFELAWRGPLSLPIPGPGQKYGEA